MNVDLSNIENTTIIESPGCRLCGCTTSKNGEDPIISINQGRSYVGNEEKPKQTPFLGAGLIFATGQLLREVPFDPFLPWTFFGGEVLYSMRIWTSGWNIYAPHRNLVIHQYHGGVTGIPRFFASVNSVQASLFCVILSYELFFFGPHQGLVSYIS